jgi:hypothetical protein
MASDCPLRSLRPPPTALSNCLWLPSRTASGCPLQLRLQLRRTALSRAAWCAVRAMAMASNGSPTTSSKDVGTARSAVVGTARSAVVGTARERCRGGMRRSSRSGSRRITTHVGSGRVAIFIRCGAETDAADSSVAARRRDFANRFARKYTEIALRGSPVAAPGRCRVRFKLSACNFACARSVARSRPSSRHKMYMIPLSLTWNHACQIDSTPGTGPGPKGGRGRVGCAGRGRSSTL